MAIDRNPGGNVEVRNPSQGNRILANEPYFNPWYVSRTPCAALTSSDLADRSRFKIRAYMRVYFAEFLGTYILVLWGEGVSYSFWRFIFCGALMPIHDIQTQAQVVAARKTPTDYLSVAWGWGVGFMVCSCSLWRKHYG
jgi:hypothetical protein